MSLFNPFKLSEYMRVSNNALRRFQDILMQEGYITTVRTTRGEDIEAACGQLAGSVKDITRRSERYRTRDRKSTRLNSSHVAISYAVFCLKKKKHKTVKI